MTGRTGSLDLGRAPSRAGRPGRGLVIAGGVTARAAAVAREGFELKAAAMDRPLDEAPRRRWCRSPGVGR